MNNENQFMIDNESVTAEEFKKALDNFSKVNMAFVENTLTPNDDITESNKNDKDDAELEETEDASDSENESETNKDDDGIDTETKAKNEEDIKAFRELPFIDLYQKREEYVKQRENLKSAKEMLDTLQSSTIKDKFGQMIEASNELDMKGIAEDAKEFMSQYEPLMNECNRVIECADKVLAEFDKDEVNKSSFLANSLCQSIDIKVTKVLDSGDCNALRIAKRMNIIKDAYSNRTDYSYIFNKLKYHQNVKNIYTDYKKLGGKKVLNYINKQFSEAFKDPNMKNFINIIQTMLPEDIENLYTALFITYWLARVYEREYDSGNFAYVKTLMMNVYDTLTGVYDLSGGADLVRDTIVTIARLLDTFAMLKRTKSKKETDEAVMKFYIETMNSYEVQRNKLLNPDNTIK